MRKMVVLGLALLVALMLGCNYKPYYFGVKSQAAVVPQEIAQTEVAIERAEGSSGAQYCPDKVARARELAREGTELYWACQTDEAMEKLAEARRLAEEAEGCQPPPPPPAPPPPPPPAEPEAAVIILEGVLFGFDSAELSPTAKVILDQQVMILEENPGLVVQVAGHTDSVGPDAYNQRLSERRANAVAQYMVEQRGMDPSRLSAVGYGESQPIDTNDTEEGRARNRRVELTVIE